jgi:putative copper export protein
MLLHIHIVAASFWIGMIVVETLVELQAAKGSAQDLHFVARAHKTVDTYFEGPVVAIVLVTGSILLYQAWPDISFLLAVKVIAGLLAVVINIICIYFVLARVNAKDEQSFQMWQRRVLQIGPFIPVAYLALAIGIYGV